MFPISNTGRSVSNSPPSGTDGNFGNSFAPSKDFYKNLIFKANSVPIIQIFKIYGIKFSPGNLLTTCPFRFHKGGRERTPSFSYYPNTNTFYCHGCTSGTRVVDFVSKMDNISRTDAAHKILHLFSDQTNDGDFIDPQDAIETLEIMMDFSNSVREFKNNNFGGGADQFIEKLCQIYDELNTKHKLDNAGLKSSVDKFKNIIENYKH